MKKVNAIDLQIESDFGGRDWERTYGWQYTNDWTFTSWGEPLGLEVEVARDCAGEYYTAESIDRLDPDTRVGLIGSMVGKLVELNARKCLNAEYEIMQAAEEAAKLYGRDAVAFALGQLTAEYSRAVRDKQKNNNNNNAGRQHFER